MTDWEGFRGVLNELYMVQDKHLSTVIDIMFKEHNFTASKSDYEAQFKQWDWHKNMKRSDWLYIALKSDLRKKSGRSETAVFVRGIRVQPSKVKKEISRQVRASELYTIAALPPCPEYMTVCTPPPANDVPSFAILKRRPHEIAGESSCSKRRYMNSMDGAMHVTQNEFSPLAQIWRNKFHETGKADLRGLPYFQFRSLMDSSNVKQGFRQLLTSKDAIAGNLICNFWPQSPYQLTFASNTSSSFSLSQNPEDTIDWPYSSFEDQTTLFKPFGANLFCGDEYHDTFDLLDRTRTDLSSLLSNMPYDSNEDVQSLSNTLLGPPTIDAARRFVEIGVYFCSNNLYMPGGTDPFVGSMLKIIPWSVLGPILLVQLPTIQAFTEMVFMYTIKTEQIEIVRELLHQQSLLILVRSNVQALLVAVRTSNTELVSLLLAGGANVNGDTPKGRPLTEARTLCMARLLVDAGADVNATGYFSTEYGSQWHGTAIHQAYRCGKLDMAICLISLGAVTGLCKAYYLDTQKWSRTEFSALMLGVESGSVEICRVLLQAGASVNSELINNPPEFKHCIQALSSFVSNNPHMTVLQRAAALGDCAIVELLLEHKAQINIRAYGLHGMTALEAAVSNSHLKAAMLLLANGADVNAPCNGDHSFPRYVLTTAVEMNNYRMVETLLNAGAKINVPSFGSYGSVALESAMVMDKGSDISKLLASRGSLQVKHVSPHYYQARLRKAIEQGDLALVQSIINTKMRIDLSPFLFTGGQHEITILQYSIQKCRAGGPAIFHALFSTVSRSFEHVDLYPLVIEAIRVGNLEILAILLDAGADLNATHDMNSDMIGTPLMFAVRLNNRTIVLWLLHKGANVNVVAEGFGNTGETASTALQVAFRRGRRFCGDMYHLLLDHGATVNGPVSRCGGRSELAFAVSIGKTSLVQHLLELGARVNEPPAADRGRTALQAATDVYDPQIATVQMLLDWGAYINGPTAEIDGVTALGAAASKGHFQIALILLKAGAAVDALDSFGWSPLVLAASRGRLDMVHLLLKAGAKDVPAEHCAGLKAEAAARNRGHIAIVDLLKNWKKDENI